MNTLFSKTILFLVLLLIPSFAVLSSGIYFNISAYEKQKRLFASYELQKTVQYLEKVPQLSYVKLRRLQRIRAGFSDKKQRVGLSQIIIAHQHGQKHLLEKYIRRFIRVEQKMNRQMKAGIELLLHRFRLSLAGFLVSFCLGVVLWALFLKKKVFSPLREMENSIHAFKENRDEYSYGFDKVEQNEIGNLRTSFYALVDIIINQMDKLKQLDKAKSDFVSIASHELRTPLTSIKGSLNLISTFINDPGKNQDNSLSVKEQIKDLLAIAEEESDRIIRLVNQLLDIAKIDAGRFPLNKEWFFIHQFMLSCIESVYSLAERARVKIEVLSQGDMADFKEQVQIFADQDSLKQVLINLLSNAIKHSSPKKEIQVKWSINENGEVKIEVRDEGQGISKEVQNKIFDKFVQVTKGDHHSKLMRSTGLGLTIAKALIEEHDGKIGLLSEEGEGSNFYFVLPKWQFYKKPLPGEQGEQEGQRKQGEQGEQATVGEIRAQKEQQVAEQVAGLTIAEPSEAEEALGALGETDPPEQTTDENTDEKKQKVA